MQTKNGRESYDVPNVETVIDNEHSTSLLWRWTNSGRTSHLFSAYDRLIVIVAMLECGDKPPFSSYLATSSGRSYRSTETATDICGSCEGVV